MIRKILTLLFILNQVLVVSAQNKSNDYVTNWKTVDDFEKKGLTQSATKEVQKIFDLAAKDNNDVQQVKAAMYLMKYRNMVEEDSRVNNIFFIDTLVAKSKAPVTNILYSMQAEMLVGYKNNNRFKFYDRTQLAQETASDIQTWSLEKLLATINSKYLLSLQNQKLLQSTSLAGFEAILQKGENTRHLRPTLYDLLAHRALDHFTNDENDVADVAYKFIINDEQYFSPVDEFTKLNIQSADTSSQYVYALKIFQELLRFHANDKDPSALVDADLKRLNFVREKGVFTDKDKLYEKAVQQLVMKFAGHSAGAVAAINLAQFYTEKGYEIDEETNEENTVQHNWFQKAEEVAEKIISKFPNSNEAAMAANLLTQIRRPDFNIKTEQVQVPNVAFKNFIRYKNTEKIYLRIIKVTEVQLARLNNLQQDDETKVQAYLKTLPVSKNWEQALPVTPNRTYTTAEFKADALPAGNYIFAASLKPDFSLTDNIVAFAEMAVTNISFIANSEDEIYVLHRNEGDPLAGAKVELWTRNFDYKTRTWNETRQNTYTADNNGKLKIVFGKNNDRYQNPFLKITHAGEQLRSDQSFFSYRYDSERPDKMQQRTFLFTDRGIYRPGQTIYFKGITIQTDGKRKNSVVAGKKSQVDLLDANGQKVGSVKVTTNKYGSYTGSFEIPVGKMNGSFQIRDSSTNNTLFIQVEEYKRPKFLVEVKKPEGTYRVNDSVSITGTAKAYAGNNIDGAKVKYRVVRKVNYPVWFWGYGRKFWPPYRTREMEITNGDTFTNTNGEFTVTFKAIPDETVDKKNQPQFSYEIIADVTDLNGETRTGRERVTVAYQALELTIVNASAMPSDSVKSIKVLSKNMNGLHDKARVNFQMIALEQPDKIYRNRYWETPDTVLISRVEFEQLFPYDAYGNEDKIENWKQGKTVINVTDTTSVSGKFNLPSNNLAAGWYKIIVTTTDKFGEAVKAESFVKIEGINDRITEPIELKIANKNQQPGGKTKYSFSTGYDKIWLINSQVRSDESVVTRYETVKKNDPVHKEISIAEPDRGGIAINYAFVKHNRVYSGNGQIQVPWNNKDVSISYETFRDKILPGAEEKWTIKISGDNAEKVAAETLVSMYDASLDQFHPHSWQSLKGIWPTLNKNISWYSENFSGQDFMNYFSLQNNLKVVEPIAYEDLQKIGWGYYAGRGLHTRVSVYSGEEKVMDEVMQTGRKAQLTAAVTPISPSAGQVNDVVVTGYAKNQADTAAQSASAIANDAPVQARKDFKETAFFFPQLETNANGEISFSFTMPEALTSWKMMTLAHSTGLASAYSEKTVITQKPLMVQPNPPRFFREGDEMELSAKLVNMSESEITGTAKLELMNATTNQPVDGWFKNQFPQQYFTVAAGQSSVVKFPVTIPYEFMGALMYRITASANNVATTEGITKYTDGEEMVLPVLTNRTLVTESVPLTMKGTGTANFRFDKLLQSGQSNTLNHKSITVEYSSNPVWYAVQALPYLMEYPYECAEQVFNRYYANALAAHIVAKMPKIKAVFDKWKAAPSGTELLSNLEKNQELKNALLEETPWVMDAKNETEQKKNIAQLFDLVKLAKEQTSSLNKLKEMQKPNGAFPWFRGGYDDRFITQYIVAGIGHLVKLNAISNEDLKNLQPILDKAIPYLDARLRDDYIDLQKNKVKLTDDHLSNLAIHYLYARSFFDKKLAAQDKTAFDYFNGQAKNYWLKNSRYMQGMIALALHRTGDNATPKAILASLKENAILSKELGMYWKEFTGGYYWFNAPIEAQSVMIEAFTDIVKDVKSADEMKTWLLRNKQVQSWESTKATADAVYALLFSGSDWTATERSVNIKLGNYTVNTANETAGSGYIKDVISPLDVKPEMGNISVTVTDKGKPIEAGISWGAVYWQYFEDLDKITTSSTPLALKKQLFVERNSDRGPVLEALEDGANLKVGDKIRVRIELRADRDMEYIHMKDMRAAALEPTNVISAYKWQGGLGYYESTKDASTNFFFNWLPRGTYVFEYSLFATHAGNFSNGITTIQCMYAPEFNSHSEGVRINID